MFCPKCGNELRDGASFCSVCGAILDDVQDEGRNAEQSGTEHAEQQPWKMRQPRHEMASKQGRSQQKQQSQHDRQQQAGRQEEGWQQPQYDKKRASQHSTGYRPQYTQPKSIRQNLNKKKTSVAKIVLIVAACAIAFLGTGGYLIYKWVNGGFSTQAAQTAVDEAHTPHAVVFTVSAPGYDDATSSKIPLRVTGVDLDGKEVDGLAFIGSDGRGLSLVQGTYSVSVAASPLLANGTLYTIPNTLWNVSIGSDIAADADVIVPSELPVSLVVADAATVSDDQINNAYDAAIVAGIDTAKADALKAAAISARQSAITAAAVHYENEYFSLDMPVSWANSYTMTEETNENGGYDNYYEDGTCFWTKQYTFTSNVTYQSDEGESNEAFYVTILDVDYGAQGNVEDAISNNMGVTSTSPSYSVWFRYGYLIGSSNEDINYVMSTFKLK